MKVPDGWTQKALEDVADIKGGIQKTPDRSAANNQVRYLTVAHVQRNRVDLRDKRYFSCSEAEVRRWKLEPEDVLIIEGNGSAHEIGRTALFPKTKIAFVHQNHVIRIRSKREYLVPYYLNAFLNSDRGQNVIQNNSFSSSGLRTLSVGRIREFRLPLPPLPEQKKIAEILGACDEAIEAQGRLIAQKEQRKKGLMQQLLTGKSRFPQFDGTPWREVKASSLFSSRSERNSNNAPVLSVTQDVGILLRSEVERRISGAAENFPNYKMVHPGDFVISLRSFQGGLEYSRIKGAVSPAYHVIRNKKDICEEFYRYYFKSWVFVGRLKIATIGIRDGKQIAFRDFSFMRLPAPSVEEQRAISSLLCSLDEEISLQRTKLGHLKQQKKGLMQLLLTGKMRVAV